jgi:hypothetical protein
MIFVWAVWLPIQILFWLGDLLSGRRNPRGKMVGSSLRQSITFLRPIKSGAVDLQSRLAQFVKLTESGDQVLFGVTADQIEEILVCSALSKAGVQINTVICEPNAFPNPKISKLSQLEIYARHDLRLLLDTEADLSQDLLNDLLRKSAKGAAVTAFYGFPAARNNAQLMDSISSCCFLWAGTIWMRRLAHQNFVFGACLLFKKHHLKMIGGWERIGALLAEDYHFGNLLSQQGVRIELADLPLNLVSDPCGWASYLQHQRRVALTYRVTNRIGYLGSVAIQALPLLTFSTIANPRAGLTLILPLILFRSVVHHQILRRLNVDVSFWKIAIVTPGIILTETVTWLMSWFSSSVQWSQQQYKITREGTMERYLDRNIS